MDRHHPPAEGSPEWAERIIQVEVRVTLPRLAPFGWDDEDDLVQECCIHWERRKDAYVPERASLETFLKRLTANKLTDLQRREIVRRRRAPVSLDQVAGDDGEPLADRVTDLGPLPAVLVEREELKVRVNATYRRLSTEDLAVVKGYADGLTPTEMSKNLGRSRQSIYRAGERIRAVFTAAGLREFLS